MPKFLPHDRVVDAERSARGHWTVTLPAGKDDIPVQLSMDDFAFHHLFKEATPRQLAFHEELTEVFGGLAETTIKTEALSRDAMEVLRLAEKTARSKGDKVQVSHLLLALLSLKSPESETIARVANLAKTIQDAAAAIGFHLIPQANQGVTELEKKPTPARDSEGVGS